MSTAALRGAIRVRRETAPVPPPRLIRRRVRDEVRDGASVAAFTLFASTAVALVLTVCIRLGS